MKTDINDYILTVKGNISPEMCDNIVEEIKDKEWQDHKFYSQTYDLNVKLSREKESEILYNSASELSKKLMDNVWEGLNEYVSGLEFPWFKGWHGYLPVRYGRFTEGKEMATHCDHIHSMFDGNIRGVPVLSVVGMLNDDYEGGDFIMLEDKKIELGKGDLLVFPSNFMFPHKITEVTKGTRYSFTTWAW